MAEIHFTKAQLAKFDGQDGRKAFVAVDGIVYDVTNVDAWINGKHHGHVAGKNLSDAITKAPHKKSVLAKLPKVGTYTN